MIYTLHRTLDGCTWTCRGCGVMSPVLRDDRAGDRWQRRHTSGHQGQRPNLADATKRRTTNTPRPSLGDPQADPAPHSAV